MASISTQEACTSSSSSSSSNSLRKYDVFLSFHGKDTRKNFTDHLYTTLKQKGINTYRDNENLEQGKPIASGLMKAIEESKYAIIVLSENYASSKWCLNELVKILECMKEKELKVLPVFYHVFPSDVGNQKETFGKAFLNHEEDRKVSIEQIQKWRTALKEVSKIRGWHLLDRLQMMEWHDYPLKFMPTSFQPDNLVELIMPRSHLEQLPGGFSNLAKLRLLDLRDSKVLVKTPNFIGCPNLERLIFQGCTSLYELHPSVGALNMLTLLNLKDCRSLTGLPCEINLKSLQIFILSGCSSLKKFSEIGTNMTSLSELYLDGIAVEELPSSLERLTGMTVLSLQGCKNLSSFPSVNLPSLKTLNLSGFKYQPPKSCLSHRFSLVRAAHAFFQGCFPIQEAINLLLPRLRFIVSLNLADRNLWDGGLPDDLSGLSSLQELDLSKNNFKRLPDSIYQLSKLKFLKMNECSRLQSLPDLPLSVGYVRAGRCPLLEKYSNQDVAWTSGERGFTMVVCNNKDDDQNYSICIPILPYDDPSLERFVEGEIQQNKCVCEFSNLTETPEWFSHQSPGSSVTIPLPSDLRDDSSWIGIALFTSVVILENLNNVSSAQDDDVSIDFICRSDIIEVPRINCPLNITRSLPVFHARSFGLKVLIPAGKLKDHLKDCSCIRAFIRSKCTYFEIKMCGARVLYEQDLVKFMRANGKMKQISKCNLVEVESSRLYQEVVQQNKSFFEFSNSTEIPEWFSHQNLGSSIRMPLPLDLHDNGRWLGIALFAVVVVHKNLNSQDYKVFIEFNCRPDMVEGPVDRCTLDLDISEPLRHDGSFSFKLFVQAWQLRNFLKKCSWISTLITSDSPNVKIKMCGAGVVYKQDLEKFLQAEGKINQRSKCQMNKLESSQSSDRLKGKLMSLLLRVYQGDLARNHKYDYVFPHTTVPDWFINRSFCSDIRIRLPPNLQCDGRWMGIAVCAYYTVHKQPAISGDNKNLTSFLNFYNHLIGRRVRLTRYRVFQESKDIFVESSHRILVFYIPHVLLRLEECQHIGASFEHNKPDVQVKECGLRLLYEQDVEKFVQTLAQCMLESPDAYHEFFYQNLLHQVEEREASKDFGFSSSLQRMPQPMPILQPSIENIAEGCTSSETSPSSFIGFLATARKEQCASIMSSESLIKARLEKNFDEGEIFHCCFAEREIPQWFCCKKKGSVKLLLSPEFVNDPDWMGFALCGLFLFNRHPTAVRQRGSKKVGAFPFSCFFRTRSCHSRLVCNGLLNINNELVTLNQRAFIWVMFIPRTTHAHFWSQSTEVKFWLNSSYPDLSAKSFGINLVYRHNMEELRQILVQCSDPFDSFLDPCNPWEFCIVWHGNPELFIGTKNSYEELHPQRLFISQEETSVTAQYSYEDSYPHNCFRYFHPSTLYNSCFPTRRTPRWFNHHCRLGHSVTIEIPPNLYEDNNWLGLALYASILIPRDQENAVSANSSHFLYCQFQTSKSSLDNQILVCRTTDEENNWLHQFFGLIWISYIPGEALKDMLHQCGHIKASFVSDWPSVMVQKCGLRLLYQHDLSQFEQQLKHCNASISALRDFICQFSRSGYKRKDGRICLTFPTKFVSPLNKYDQLGFDGSCDYNSCCPPIEIPRWFNIRSDKSHVKVRLTRKLRNRCTWLGVALCAVFLVTEDVAGLNDIMDSISSCQLICHLKASNGLIVKPRPIHWPTKENLMMSVLGGGFTWVTYIPRGSFPDWLYGGASIKFSFKTNCHYLKVQNCGLCPLYQKTENIDRKIWSGIQNVIRETDTLGCDGCIFYNSRLPSSKFLEWFNHRSDEPRLKIPLPPNLYNDSTWMGLVLYAYFAIDENPATHFDILDSDSAYSLLYHLQTNVGSVRPLAGYRLTKENLVMLKQGGCILLSYEGRGSFQNCLNQVSCIKASFRADPGLKVEKCGLRLLYHYDLEEFEQTISHSMNSSLDGWNIIYQGTPSRTSSSRKESNFGNLRGPIDPKVKGKRVLE